MRLNIGHSNKSPLDSDEHFKLMCCLSPDFTNTYQHKVIFDFRPLIQNLDKCEQEIYVNASTTYITSPNYPQNYDNNVNCDWILKSDPLARIVVTIVYVSMESSVRRCRYDVLTIFDGKYGSREDWNR